MTLTLYRSGAVHAPGTPRATALLADSAAGEIVWVGTDEAAARLGEPDREVDLDGRLMVPAFVDAWAADDAEPNREVAAANGIGAVHVLTTEGDGYRESSAPDQTQAGLRLFRVSAIESAGQNDSLLTERYTEGTVAGAQVAVIVRDPAEVRQAVLAAGRVTELLGLPRVVAARHRLHVAADLPVDVVPELARLGLVVCFGGEGSCGGGGGGGGCERPFRALAAAGVAFAFGSGGAVVDPWGWVRAATTGEQAVSARAAFAAATRGGHRAAGLDSAGALRPGAPATFAVWRVTGELVVRTPDSRVAAWSTDPRAATPGLPDLEQDASPECDLTVVDGVTVFAR